MRIRKTLISALTLAIAIAFSPLSELRAASFADPGLRQGAETLTQTVAMKKKTRKAHARKAGKKRHARRAGSKGAGKCGAYMFYSAKGHKCMDARAKS
jgi:uncharacterized low-complexity protein